MSGDLGYTVGIEHPVAARHGAPPVRYALRVTIIFRREDGLWKVVHRHGDRYDECSRTIPAEQGDRVQATTGTTATDEAMAGP